MIHFIIGFIITLIAYVVYALVKKYRNTKVENFFTRFFYSNYYCQSCNKRSHYACSKCDNCGFCITREGRGDCVQGDMYGPYFRRDCVIWDYNKSPSYSYYPTYPYRRLYF